MGVFQLNIFKSVESWSGTFLSSNMYSAVLTFAVVDILYGGALNCLSVLSVVGYAEGSKSCWIRCSKLLCLDDAFLGCSSLISGEKYFVFGSILVSII